MTTKNKNNKMFDNKSVSLEHAIDWGKGTRSARTGCLTNKH